MVGIVDSGAGGLSIASEILQRRRHLDLVFIADKAGYPYGVRETQYVIDRILKLAIDVTNQFHLDALIIACNTASTVALPILRQHLTIPIIGVVPAIKPAARLCKPEDTVLVLATPATTERTYLKELVNQFANHLNVVLAGSKALVEIAEEFVSNEAKINQSLLTDELDLIFSAPKNPTATVLACTHFPLIKTEIEKALASKGISTTLIDSGQAIANRLDEVLQLTHIPNSQTLSRVLLLNTSKSNLDGYASYLKRTCDNFEWDSVLFPLD